MLSVSGKALQTTCGVCLTTFIIGILLDFNYFFDFLLHLTEYFLKNVVQNISLCFLKRQFDSTRKDVIL